MPQFDLAVFPSQIFWLIIFFTILMVYTVMISVPRMKSLLDERWQKTKGYRIEADRYAQEQDSTVKNIDRELLASKKEAHDVIMTTQEDVNRDFSERKKSMLVLMKQQMASAETSIQEEKKRALSDIKAQTKLITQDIMSKVMPLNSQMDSVDSFLDDKIDMKVLHGS